jgi:glycosyltransferase involved in cell wall biosynthesis
MSIPAVDHESVTTPAENHQSAAEKLRVLHINSGNLYGGVETILVTLARLRGLCPAMEPHFALCHEGRLREELRDSGVPVYTLGKVRISRPWTVWRARRRLREVLRQERFGLVICHMPWSLAVFGKAVRDQGQPLGFWAHAFHDGRSWLEWLARRIRPDVAIGNSNYTEAGLGNFFPDVKRGVVYPPVALTTSPEANQWRSMVRKELRADNDTVAIIQVGRLEAGKGHLCHLRALSLLKDSNRWVYWIVGGAQRPQEQEYLNLLQNTAGELGITDRVRFLGERADIRQLLVGADIFCQPNLHPESFGIVFIEALWAGLPVVTSGIGGALEIIDGSCGVLIRPGNTELLAESLRKLIESRELRVRLGEAGATRAGRLSDPATQMEKLRKLSLDLVRMR